MRILIVCLILSLVAGCGRGPLVVGGGSGNVKGDGTQYWTINGNPEYLSPSDPIRYIAHFAILPDPSLKTEYHSSSGEKRPNKFVWRVDYEYTVDGAPFSFNIVIDGRAHTFSAGGDTFDLADGNYIRVKILPGPKIQASQLPIIDLDEDDPAKIKEVFLANP